MRPRRFFFGCDSNGHKAGSANDECVASSHPETKLGVCNADCYDQRPHRIERALLERSRNPGSFTPSPCRGRIVRLAKCRAKALNLANILPSHGAFQARLPAPRVSKLLFHFKTSRKKNRRQ
jgi:hypothetical protein